MACSKPGWQGKTPRQAPAAVQPRGGGPELAKSGPKQAKNGQKRPRKAPRGPRARAMTPRSPLGAHRTQFWHLSNPQRPLHRLFRPILGRFGPDRGATDGPGVKSEKWPYRSPDVPNRDFEGTILGCNPPVWVVSTPQNGLNAHLGGSLAHAVHAVRTQCTQCTYQGFFGGVRAAYLT